MDIGKLFLSLGIKADTKGLEGTINKIEELKKQSKELNKALKETKTNIGGIKSGSSVSSNPQVASAQIETKLAQERLKMAKVQAGFEKIEEKKEKDKRRDEEKEAKKKEKEQKQREKDREKATKNFFKQIDNGFGFIAKAFTGSIIGSGIAGIITNQASKSVSLNNIFQQYGLDQEQGQRYSNVFRRGNPQLDKETILQMITGVAETLASRETKNNPVILQGLGALGLDPSITDPFTLFEAIRRNPNKLDRKYLSSLATDLGISPAFSQSLNPETEAGKLFEESYNRPIMSKNQIRAGTNVATKFSDLGDTFDRTKAKILEQNEGKIVEILQRIEKALTPENFEKIGEYVAIGLTGYLVRKNPIVAGVFGLKYGYDKLKTPEGRENIMDSIEDLLIKTTDRGFTHRINGKEVSTEEFREYKDGDDDFRKEYQRYINDTTNNSIGPTSYNINTNINASSIDNTTLPVIADTIVSKVEGLNSKYTNFSLPV